MNSTYLFNKAPITQWLPLSPVSKASLSRNDVIAMNITKEALVAANNSSKNGYTMDIHIPIPENALNTKMRLSEPLPILVIEPLHPNDEWFLFDPTGLPIHISKQKTAILPADNKSPSLEVFHSAAYLELNGQARVVHRVYLRYDDIYNDPARMAALTPKERKSLKDIRHPDAGRHIYVIDRVGRIHDVCHAVALDTDNPTLHSESFLEGKAEHGNEAVIMHIIKKVFDRVDLVTGADAPTKIKVINGKNRGEGDDGGIRVLTPNQLPFYDAYYAMSVEDRGAKYINLGGAWAVKIVKETCPLGKKKYTEETWNYKDISHTDLTALLYGRTAEEEGRELPISMQEFLKNHSPPPDFFNVDDPAFAKLRLRDENGVGGGLMEPEAVVPESPGKRGRKMYTFGLGGRRSRANSKVNGDKNDVEDAKEAEKAEKTKTKANSHDKKMAKALSALFASY